MNREQREADFVGFFGSRVVTMRRLAYALCGDWHTADEVDHRALTPLTCPNVARRLGTTSLLQIL